MKNGSSAVVDSTVELPYVKLHNIDKINMKIGWDSSSGSELHCKAYCWTLNRSFNSSEIIS
jgi:hypothetical protein